MALGFYFASPSFSTDNYDEALRRLDAAGASSPKGRSYHCAMLGDGGVQIFDVWDSKEDFEKFGETLMPILSALGVDPGQPQVAQVHNVIVG